MYESKFVCLKSKEILVLAYNIAERGGYGSQDDLLIHKAI
jgi:hypothetical protein